MTGDRLSDPRCFSWAILAGHCIFVLIQTFPPTAAAQWPHFGGPRQDFSCEPVELAREWPEEGPTRAWSRPLGDGYSAVSVDAGRIYTMYRDGDDEVVIAMEASSGKTLWEHRATEPIDTSQFAGRYGYGPRSTPLIAGNRVFAIGFNGVLWCLDRDTGKQLWSVRLLHKFNAPPTRWGYANSPLAYQESLIVPVGGKSAAFVALAQATGRVVWRRHDFENSYGTPMLIRVDGREQVVCLTARHIVGLAPGTGDLLWHHAHEGQWLNNIPGPSWGSDNLLFVTSEGNAGSRVLKLATEGTKVTVEEVWASKKFRVVHRNIIRMGSLVYGSSGDFGPTIFSAVDVNSGDVVWKRRDIGRVGMLQVGNQLLMLEESGRLILATPEPTGIVIHAHAKILDEPAWTIPTLVGRRLYLRDRRRILALDLP